MTLRVTLTYLPFGQEYNAQVIETLTITNRGPDSRPDGAGDSVRIYDVVSSLTKKKLCVIHDRDDGAQQLVEAALMAMRTAVAKEQGRGKEKTDERKTPRRRTSGRATPERKAAEGVRRWSARSGHETS